MAVAKLSLGNVVRDFGIHPSLFLWVIKTAPSHLSQATASFAPLIASFPSQNFLIRPEYDIGTST